MAKASGVEAREDFEDILRREGLPRWHKDDPRLIKLRSTFESNPPSSLSLPSISTWARGKMEKEGRDGIEEIVNYGLDLLIRAVEELHKIQGGYNENLMRKRLEYRKTDQIW